MTEAPERRIASALARRGLAVPARVLLEAHRPLAPLFADASAALVPLLGAALGRAAELDLRRVADPDPDGDPTARLVAELAAIDPDDEADALAR